MDADANPSSDLPLHPRPDPRDDPDDAARLHAYATALADGVERALGPWVLAGVDRRVMACRGTIEAPDQEAAEVAARRCVAEVAPAVRAVLDQDIDAQRSNPLEVVRRAVRYPTAVLRDLGVPPVPRDRDSERLFPDDLYDLTPASFADLDPALREPALLWGAAKAHVHLRRRRADGQR
jgi:hypothetical protein